jgi:hypothetical protein
MKGRESASAVRAQISTAGKGWSEAEALCKTHRKRSRKKEQGRTSMTQPVRFKKDPDREKYLLRNKLEKEPDPS